MPQSTVVSTQRTEERLYVAARVAMCVVLAGLAFLPLSFPNGSVELWMYGFLWLLFALVTAFTAIMVRRDPERFRQALMWMLAPDLMVMAGYTYLLAPADDGFYPIVMALPVVYALLLPMRNAVAAGIGAAIAYLIGQALIRDVSATDVYLTVVAAAMIPTVTALVAFSVQRQRLREADAEKAIEQRRDANLQLQRRIGELQAIREITDAIHSTLDFSEVAPRIIDILGKALDIEACTLLVMDKVDSTTLFSATKGPVGAEKASVPSEDAALLEGGDEHFSCISVLDHPRAAVVFCAPAVDIDRVTDADRTVLVAVANELVVAVENSRLYQLTALLAITDELTGLYNYRYLQNRLDEEIERSRRYDTRVSLLMIDADDFKGYNDAHGHVAGDLALEELASVLKANVREVDLVARYGGEEFSIMLPETDAAGAYVVAEKVREAVSNHDFLSETGTRDRKLTVSIGLATFPTHAPDKEVLLKESDDALYHAKNGGKNRVRTPRRKEAGPPRTATTDDPQQTGETT